MSHGEQNADNLTQTLIDKVKNIIFGLVRLEAQYIKSLEQYLENSLGVTGNKVEQLMWENPRSLMLEVIPTISRRLFCGWKMAFPLPGLENEPQMYRHPVPEFIPENLFSELSLPEVSITIPAGDVNDQIKTVSMPVLQTLREFAPGRVSRRFADRRGGLSHWIKLNPDETSQTLSISEYATSIDYIGSFSSTINSKENNGTVAVFQSLGVSN